MKMFESQRGTYRQIKCRGVKAGSVQGRQVLCLLRKHLPNLFPERLHPDRLHPERLHPERLFTERLHPERLLSERLHPERLFPVRLHPVLLLSVLLPVLLLGGCRRYEPAAVAQGIEEGDLLTETTEAVSEEVPESPEETETEAETAPPEPEDTRIPVKVKGLYLAAKPVGVPEFMEKVIRYMDETELNAVVIDLKDDYGKITYQMKNVPLVDEMNSVEVHIDDLPGLLKTLHQHKIYCIARIVTMRDPHTARKKPEWALTLPDGSLYKDGSGYTWMNPYKQEYWDFLVEIGTEAARIGFDEIQFDYIRFCTEKGVKDVVYDEEDVQGRDKISVITELVGYLYERLRKTGAFVSCDVFGTIIGSSVDARSVGQSYTQMAGVVDYICPMIYPSHYADGNFGLEHPDLQPYELIRGALKRSASELRKAAEEGTRQAVVRPWLQSFTASWLGKGKYLSYDAAAVRQEIQGVYDAGYDEWILWSASASYFYDGFLSEKEAEKERAAIEESRAAIPVEENLPEEETFPEELEAALVNGELSPEDEKILLEDGPVISYE